MPGVQGMRLGPRVVDVRDQGQLGKLLASKRLEKPDRSIQQKASTFHVFEQGLVLGDASDAVAEGFRWDEVDEYRKSFVTNILRGRTQITSYKSKNTEYSFTFKVAERTIQLSGRTDEKRTLTGSVLQGGPKASVLEGFDELVSHRVCAAQLPGMLRTLEGGGTLEFGGLTVSLDGLTRSAVRKKNRQLAWSEMRKFGVSNGQLQISGGSTFLDWYFSSVGSVPNIDALLEILRIVPAAR
jgi:hypothetical protein